MLFVHCFPNFSCLSVSSCISLSYCDVFKFFIRQIAGLHFFEVSYCGFYYFSLVVLYLPDSSWSMKLPVGLCTIEGENTLQFLQTTLAGKLFCQFPGLIGLSLGSQWCCVKASLKTVVESIIWSTRGMLVTPGSMVLVNRTAFSTLFSREVLEQGFTSAFTVGSSVHFASLLPGAWTGVTLLSS